MSSLLLPGCVVDHPRASNERVAWSRRGASCGMLRRRGCEAGRCMLSQNQSAVARRPGWQTRILMIRLLRRLRASLQSPGIGTLGQPFLCFKQVGSRLLVLPIATELQGRPRRAVRPRATTNRSSTSCVLGGTTELLFLHTRVTPFRRLRALKMSLFIFRLWTLKITLFYFSFVSSLNCQNNGTKIGIKLL